MRQAAMMVLIQDGLILGVSRRHDHSKFGLPGGAVEPGETPLQAAIRETQEETGALVTAAQHVYTRAEAGDRPGAPEDFEALTFYATAWSGNPSSMEDMVTQWITVQQLTDVSAAFPIYNLTMIEHLLKKFPDLYLRGIS